MRWPGPVKLIAGGRYSLDFAIHVAIDKWCDHLPLERQVRRMKRAGLDVDSQTLWDQTWALTCCFRKAIGELHQYLLSKDVLLADESHWPLIGQHDQKTKNWFTWALVSDNAALYTILNSRSNEAAAEVLGDFRGTLLTDGYIVYTSKSKELGFRQANDWCHPRRHFLEAEDSAPDDAKLFIDDIGKLFLIEREIAEASVGLSPDEALALRAHQREERSKPVVAAIGRQAAEVTALRDSPIARAVKYLENRWKGLCVFLSDPRVPITSNAVERALRCSVIGRNNFFGSRSERGIESAGTFYSMVESAKLNGLEPRAYLKLAALAHLRGERVPLPHEIARSKSPSTKN
jgi:transposase